MAVIKVFDVHGSKELKCFDNLDYVPYLLDEDECEPTSEPEEED